MDDSNKSEYNMSFALFYRLNYFLFMADENSSQYKSHEWLQTLLVIFREIAFTLTEEEVKIKSQEAMNLIQDIQGQSKNRFKIPSVGIEPQLYWKLNNFELFLRQKMNDKGMLIKVMDDASRALR